VKPFRLGDYLLVSYLITYSISFIVIGLFKLFHIECVKVGFLRKWSTSKLSNLFAHGEVFPLVSLLPFFLSCGAGD
jgi:hypothetical protein